MRLIGHLKTEESAKTFGDCLAGLQIKNMIEPETDGTFAVWIYSEDQIDASRTLLEEYFARPHDPKFRKSAGAAEALKRKEEQEREEYEKRFRTRDQIWKARSAHLTIAMILISVGIALISIPRRNDVLEWLLIDNSLVGFLQQVRHGQVWRLITPIFVHGNLLQIGGILHLLFNMMWLKDLGPMIELRQGTAKFALLVLVLAIVPNLAQYVVSGPMFYGMSGVVYGLFGYIWIRGKTDPASGYYLHQNVVIMMVAWFFVCFVGIFPGVANTVHAVGLMLGMLIGWLPIGRTR